MEIFSTTFNGNKVSVLFNGSTYLFHNYYYGFLAIARRAEYVERGREFFTIDCGNHHCLGGSLNPSGLVSGVKRFIRREECSHGAKTVDFELHDVDLANAFLDIVDGFKVR